MIRFTLDPQSGVSTYLQLVHQVRHAIRLGLLVPGDQLPTAKDVVADLAINPNTVLKAYRDLERDGLVQPRPGLGTFISATLGGSSRAEKARLQEELSDWVRDALEAGLEQEDIRALFSRALLDIATRESA